MLENCYMTDVKKFTTHRNPFAKYSSIPQLTRESRYYANVRENDVLRMAKRLQNQYESLYK